MASKVYDKHSNTSTPSTDNNPWRIVGINWTAVALMAGALVGMVIMAVTGGPF